MTAATSQTGNKQTLRKEDRREATSTPPLDAERIRNEIAARLMRLHCARQNGCTRRCRRQGRCVAADAVDALNGPRVAAPKRKGAAGVP
jgi:hypothetical protein